MHKRVGEHPQRSVSIPWLPGVPPRLWDGQAYQASVLTGGGAFPPRRLPHHPSGRHHTRGRQAGGSRDHSEPLPGLHISGLHRSTSPRRRSRVKARAIDARSDAVGRPIPIRRRISDIGIVRPGSDGRVRSGDGGAAIHAFLLFCAQGVGGRAEPGHDELRTAPPFLQRSQLREKEERHSAARRTAESWRSTRRA